MKFSMPGSVFVLAFLIGQLPCMAQPPIPSQPSIPSSQQMRPQPQIPELTHGTAELASSSNQSLVPSKNSLRKFSPIRTGDTVMPEDSFNGYAHIRSAPDLGAPGSAGSGFHHFTMPFDRYTTWYRPRAASLTKYQRCAPDSFRPRGFGNLFARPCDGYRMEYEPYSLDDIPSKYGPSYVARMPDPRCDHCEDCQD